MARDSRPPGFDMTYRPHRRQAFGPPARTWTLPGIYLVASIGFLAFVLFARLAPSQSWVFRYVVEADDTRIISAPTLALVMVLGGVAALVRTGMRGVIIHPDGIEARYVISLGWPKVRSWTWTEIDRLVFESGRVSLQLWDGSWCGLPEVRDCDGLIQILEHVASARAIPVRGGTGLVDVDDARD